MATKLSPSPVMPRLLPERARIEFHYPDENNTIAFVPFYENPDIKESQAANYAEYNPIGRAGSLYAYTGSQSRKFKVKATYTLPHLHNHPMGIARFLRTSFGNTKKEQQLLFSNINKGNSAPISSLSHSYGAFDNYRTLLLESIGMEAAAGLGVTRLPNFQSLVDRHFDTISTAWGGEEEQEWMGMGTGEFSGDFDTEIAHAQNLATLDQGAEVRENTNQVIDTLLFFMVLFRTSVVNNVSNPVEGPPILRLTHGTMYQSVPCICKSYNLVWEEEGGFDLETLTPRRLVINLELEEIRSGDFGKFDQTSLVRRNNLTGWETAIAAPYTTDPTNQAFDSYGKRIN
tara:strand:+ start:1769 stop:2800 length:1032 start_codon:yes stop_codon:yes gene_type:complete